MPKNITYVTDANGEVLIRKRKRRKKYQPFQKGSKNKKAVIITISVILGIVLLVFLIWYIGYQNMRVHYDEGKIIEYNGHRYKFNENIIDLSFIGYDTNNDDTEAGRDGQADFLLLMALDIGNSTLKGISIPRDTMIEPNNYSGANYFGVSEKEQIAVSFSYAHELDESCKKTSEAMSRLIYNIPIKYYFGLNLDGITPINDAVGGIDLKALESIPNTNIEKDKNITLHGTNAERYVRYRDKSNINSSQMRRQRDDQYMKNFYEQSIQNIRDVYIFADLFNASLNYSVTNLGFPEFIYLSQLALTQHIDSFEITSFKGDMKKGENYAEFWANETDIYEKMLDVFYIMIE